MAANTRSPVSVYTAETVPAALSSVMVKTCAMRRALTIALTCGVVRSALCMDMVDSFSVVVFSWQTHKKQINSFGILLLCCCAGC